MIARILAWSALVSLRVLAGCMRTGLLINGHPVSAFILRIIEPPGCIAAPVRAPARLVGSHPSRGRCGVLERWPDPPLADSFDF